VQVHRTIRGDLAANNYPRQINYAFGNSAFGNFFVATTEMGICRLDFVEQWAISDYLSGLVELFPDTTLVDKPPQLLPQVVAMLNSDRPSSDTLPLHITGTAFQCQVWQALLEIPTGHLSTYSEMARSIGRSRAARAVGSAIGANSVAYFIPCHRVIRQDGSLGNYRWGITRKQALLDWEKIGPS
jgi:AraC family transcriptional regulator of adaptative response/methylated-DNA-[protein]-cysteine methyltransferase